MPNCSYRAPDGQICKRNSFIVDDHREWCEFHLQREHPEKPISAMFADHVRTLLNNQDGQLKGFVFPRGFRLRDINTNILEIDCEVDLSFADFFDTDLSKINFNNTVTAEQLNAHGYFNLLNCVFFKDVKFRLSSFHEEFFCNSTYESSSNYSQCAFNGRTTFNGEFNESVNFSDCVFSDSVTFLGGRSIKITAEGVAMSVSSSIIGSPSSGTEKKSLLQRIKEKWNIYKSRFLTKWTVWKHMLDSFIRSSWLRAKNKIKEIFNNFMADWFGRYDTRFETVKRVFNKDVIMKGIDFHRPERARFIAVDMRKARVVGTDFNGVQFYDTNWYQTELGRKGLLEEVDLKNSDIGHRKYIRPQLQVAYRNIRTAMELSKDFDTASDFYIGERESFRLSLHPLKRHFFSIDAWYNAVSRYGTSPLRAIRIIAWLMILYVAIRAELSDVSFSALIQSAELYFQHALKLFSFQKTTGIDIPNPVVWLDLAYRFIAPVMLGLTALSFRARIKRH